MLRESFVCPGCACLCDDLDLTVEDNRILEVANVCGWGAGKFLGTKKFHANRPRHRLAAFEVAERGKRQAVSYEAALTAAARLLQAARRPVIYGLTNTGCRAQAAALELARGLRARLEPGDLAFMGPFFAALREYGLFWASLEAIRDEADTLLFWGANPLHAAPRHLVRYSVFARGRFTERGLEDRRVAAVDLYPTELAHFCKPFLQVQPEREVALAAWLGEKVAGTATGPEFGKKAQELAEMLATATYGVIFCGRGVSYGPGRELMETLARLVAGLNQRCPWALLPLPGDFNSLGLYLLLLREVGTPGAPDFASPATEQGQLTPVDWREVDAILVAGADLWWFLPEEVQNDLRARQVPLVALSPWANRTTAHAAVVFPVALEGVETPEMAYRLDGLPVQLGAVLASPWPSTHQVLTDLCSFCA